MAAATLAPAIQTELRKADRSAVVGALAGLTLSGTISWLPAGHSAVDGIQKEHRPAGPTPISPNDLAEYLGVASPTHCADGWSYLSRALHAYLLGDAHSAWHFAYYAELRAAQSILSSSGCGAFNYWNCVIDAAGAIHSTGAQPTHVMVWLALSYLAEHSPTAASGIAGATRILGESIPDIIQAAYPGRGPAATSSNWIREWLFDLQTSSEDKSFRNRCSYNPHMVTPHHANIADCVAWTSALWQALAPSPGATFMEVDKQIVRAALKKEATESLLLLNSATPVTAAALQTELAAAYTRVLSVAPTFASIPMDFICDIAAPDHPLLVHAKDSSASPTTPRPALARATLLLRIATGMTQNLLRDAGQASHLEFWLDELAERQGLVQDRTDIPGDRSDFYADCAVASSDFDDLFRQGNVSLASLIGHHKTKAHTLSQAERVVQWGFFP